MIHLEEIKSVLSNRYEEQEYPALLHQLREFSEKRPLEGVSIYDATPLFLNTLVKHLVLIAGGADLTAGYGNGLPYDEYALQLLNSAGVPTLENGTCCDRMFDIVLDCAAVNSERNPRIGAAELTQSGAKHYAHANYPVFLTDDSDIKVIETGLGTGDGFRRSMEYLGYKNFNGKKITLFGFGKVGRGIALSLMKRGVDLYVVDFVKSPHFPEKAHFIEATDKEVVRETALTSWCVVTATGVEGAVSDLMDVRELIPTDVLLANMGIVDEFGEALPAERALNSKVALNFILPEPTLMRYIDPVMALDNEGAVRLLTDRTLLKGLVQPSREQQAKILSVVKDTGLITEEIMDYGL